MKVAVVKETFPGELRVALVPANVANLTKARLEVAVEAGAGEQAGFPDEAYREKYEGSQYLDAMVSERARSATVGILPRETSD